MLIRLMNSNSFYMGNFETSMVRFELGSVTSVRPIETTYSRIACQIFRSNSGHAADVLAQPPVIRISFDNDCDNDCDLRIFVIFVIFLVWTFLTSEVGNSKFDVENQPDLRIKLISSMNSTYHHC